MSKDADRPLPQGATAPVYMTPTASGASQALVTVGVASAYASGGASTVAVTPTESGVPKIEARLSKNVWDMTSTGFGISVGTPFGKSGTVVGGVVGYVWGQIRWAQVHKKDP